MSDSSKTLQLSLEQATGDKVTLQSMIDAHAALAGILRCSFRAEAKLSTRARTSGLQIYVSDFRNGSIIDQLTVEVIQSLDARQLAFAFTLMNPSAIIENAKNALEFWMAYSGSKEKGVNVSITAHENSNVFVNIGNGQLIVGDNVLRTAVESRAFGEQLTAPLRRGDLARIGVESATGSTQLETGDANCFTTPAEIDEDPKSAIANLVEFDKLKKSGHVDYVEDGTQVRRSFKLVSDNLTAAAIEAMGKRQVRIRYLEEFLVGPNGNRKILDLKMIAISSV